MKKKIGRTRRISGLRLDKPTVESILQKVVEQVSSSEFFMSIQKDGTRYTFESVSEFVDATTLPDSVELLNVMITERRRDADLNVRVEYQHRTFQMNSWGAGLEISADSTNEAWAAGVVDMVSSLLLPYKGWYGWLSGPSSAGIGGGMLAGGFMMAISALFAHQIAAAVMGALLGTIGLLLAWHTDRVFPSFRLSMRPSDSFLKKYQAELVTGGTVLAALTGTALLAITIAQYLKSSS